MSYCTDTYCCAPEKCWNKGFFSINFSGFHKLCEFHFTHFQSSSFLECGHCSSISLITEVPPKPKPLKFCPTCKVNTLQDPQSPSCESCLQICEKCKKISQDLKMTQCFLKMCSSCLVSEICCNYSCVICKNHQNTYALECGKTMCEKCFFECGCCENFCWNCRNHKNGKSECGKIICGSCEKFKICCEDLCRVCKIYHCWGLERRGEKVCDQCKLKFYQGSENQTSSGFEGHETIDGDQRFNQNQLGLNEEVISSQNIESLQNQKNPQYEENSLIINNNKEPISEENRIETTQQFHNDDQKSKISNNSHQGNRIFVRYPPIIQNSPLDIDDHPLKPVKKNEIPKINHGLNSSQPSYQKINFEDDPLHLSLNKNKVNKSNEVKILDFSEESKKEINPNKNPRNANNYPSLQSIKSTSIKSSKNGIICNFCKMKASYECSEGFYLCGQCFNDQLLEKISEYTCSRCNNKFQCRSLNDYKEQKLCENCVYKLNNLEKCINCRNIKGEYTLSCGHSKCNNCLIKTGKKCDSCDFKLLKCQVCGHKGYNKFKFSKCNHFGCENCKVYEYCFNCIIGFGEKLTKKLNLNKGSYSCESCNKSSKYRVQLICKDYVCKSCFLDYKVYDYCCPDCYFKTDVKVCFGCKSKYLLIDEKKHVFKSCCNLAFKKKLSFNLNNGIHYKITQEKLQKEKLKKK